MSELQELRIRMKQLIVENAVLREGLRPFANVWAEKQANPTADSHDVLDSHLRHAWQLLNRYEQGE